MPEQMSLGAVSTGARDVKPLVHPVDYSRMAIGVAVAARRIIEACPKCGRPGLAQHNNANRVWIHSEEFVAGRRKTISKCREARGK